MAMAKNSFLTQTITTLLGLIVLSVCPGLCAGQAKPVGEPADIRLLSKKAYVQGSEQRSLMLWQINPPPPPRASRAQLAKILSEPNSLKVLDITSFNQTTGDIVFGIVDAPVAGGAQNLIGAVYAIKDFTLPAAGWSGDLVIDKPSGDAYVVLARSKFQDITLSLHSASTARKIADFPYKFDLQASVGWPKPLTQLSELKTSVTTQCGIDKIEAELEGRMLVIRASRTGEKCNPTTFRFDLETKKWLAPK